MKTFLIAFLLFVLLAGGGAGTLYYLGVIHFTFARPVKAVIQVPDGAIAVPLALRPVRAYEAVRREDLLDPRTLQMHYKYLLPSTGPYAPITNPKEILGRVLRHDKEMGYDFTEADFFPPGTTPGDAAAIPPGKRAMTIDASKVAGVYALRPGNHIDLVACQVIDVKASTNANLPMLPSNSSLNMSGSVKRATFTVLVQDGLVITPVTQREQTFMGQGSGGLMPSSEIKQKPVQEIMIAVDPDEVPNLSQALAAGAQINCFLRTSQPLSADAPQASIPNAPDGTQPAVHMVEKIVGKQHNFVYLPSGGGPGAP